MLLRLTYLAVTNAFAALRLLPMSARDKDAEILALHHQLTVLERRLGERRVRFTPADRAWLAAPLHPEPRDALRGMRLTVHPDTVLRWHRDLVRRRHAAASRTKRPGRPPTVLTAVRTPRTNGGMEHWVRTRRHELLDRTLIWNQRHLLHALREFERHYNGHRPHRALHQAAPLQPAPEPITDPDELQRLRDLLTFPAPLDRMRRHRVLGGPLNEYQSAA
ncbi:integrase core domain-containing protein [Yinghuangia seranimata]|uniref:integrase core domain-containing protein n=1 Tax=Yinghuangia seranimata TaxID=408067 RepID=UPI00248B7859|nr:integrase core domain-containing protein [Yinghuangia seranimata]MDI2129422.1 integrase core domain-containing protein [Yinghuangia seranimata]